MCNQLCEINVLEKVTGFVLPIGNGAVGKSTLYLVLEQNKNGFPNTKKSMNLEFVYVNDYVEIDRTGYQIMQQFLVPPGQKSTEGIDQVYSFERIIETYEFLFRRIDVVLLTYKVDELESFNDLEYWIRQSISLCDEFTQFILVGTHLDRNDTRQVTETMVMNGINYLTHLIKLSLSNWSGRCSACEVSALTGENLEQLRHTISRAILDSRQPAG
jgi:GTPase SAR1 family protein